METLLRSGEIDFATFSKYNSAELRSSFLSALNKGSAAPELEELRFEFKEEGSMGMDLLKQTRTVFAVRLGSEAQRLGGKPGDEIIGVGTTSTAGLSHYKVVALCIESNRPCFVTIRRRVSINKPNSPRVRWSRRTPDATT